MYEKPRADFFKNLKNENLKGTFSESEENEKPQIDLRLRTKIHGPSEWHESIRLVKSL